MMRGRSIIVLGALLTMGPDAIACKYSVRDVAFVDLGAGVHRLVILADEKTPTVLAERLHSAAAGALVDTNVRPQIIRVEAISDPKLQSLLASGAITSVPAAVLIAPDDRLTVLPMALADGGSPESLWAVFTSVVSSPVRDEVLKHILTAHSILLLLEGRDEGINGQARLVAERAVDEVRKSLDELPKPIAEPPHLLVISAEQALAETVLLWSLAVDRRDATQAQIVVLYGRCRRLGPALGVPGATAAELSRRLWVVGQDCECDLDRSWLQGPMLPHQWGPRMQAATLAQLGFDAGSPLVMAEISRILARGPSSRGAAASPDDPLMGYREIEIGDTTVANGEAAERGVVTDREPAHDEAPALPLPAAKVDVIPTDGPRAPRIGRVLSFALLALMIVAGVGGGVVWLRAGRET